jgi:hypothetical protein
MIIVRTSVAAVACCLLAGCANLEIARTGCEQSTRTFAEMSGCLKAVVDRMYTPRPQYSPELSLYLAQERHIAERISANRISDFDGRVELRGLYVALQKQRAAQ